MTRGTRVPANRDSADRRALSQTLSHASAYNRRASSRRMCPDDVIDIRRDDVRERITRISPQDLVEHLSRRQQMKRHIAEFAYVRWSRWIRTR